MKFIKTNSFGARFVSGLLSVLMVMSSCPINAYADYDEDDNTFVITEEVVVDETVDEGTTEPVDENVDSIPENEDAEDQTDPEVSTPPNIEEESTDNVDGTTEPTDETVDPEDTTAEDGSEDAEVTDETTDENVDEDTTEGTTEDGTTEEGITDETTEEGTTEGTVSGGDAATPTYVYEVVLPEDATVTAGERFTISATITATATLGEETSAVQYVFEWIKADDVVMENATDTSADFIFNTNGDYVIEGKIYVDDVEVASDSINVTVEEAAPLVVFDHYFTDIDTSLVETPDLMVTTSDPSVFTKNTNVVSNFDNAYIISCGSVEEARYVYSYYVDKVDNITDLSNVISIATDDNSEDVANLTDINEGDDALSNLNEIEIENYAGYIALIDTGANADVNFSVVGDDTSDSNGHGTNMYNLIKAENPDAKVMSIKVFNGSKTDAASVYAGIMLAVESKVSVINLSLVGSDVEKNAIVKEAIQYALDNGIVVIGAAGNYNISATRFIPGCIDGVIVVGAANEDGSKYATSNFDADYYVVSTSSSEATAIYTGLYTANKLDDARISNGEARPINPVEPEVIDEAYLFAKLLSEDLGTEVTLNEDGTYSVGVVLPSNFEIQASEQHTDFLGDADAVQGLQSLKVNDSFYGTCNFNGSAGEGTASGFTGDHVFATIMSGRTLYCSCDRYWGNTTDSKGAFVLTNGTVSYKATVKTVRTSADGSKVYVDFDVMFTQDNFETRVWTEHVDTYSWTVDENAGYTTTYGIICSKCNGWHPNGSRDCDGHTFSNGSDYKLSCVVNYSITLPDGTTTTGVVRKTLGPYAAAASAGQASQANSIKSIAITEATNIIKSKIVTISDEFAGKWADDIVFNNDNTATQHWRETTQKQIYRANTEVWGWNYIYLNLTKSADTSNGYGDILNSSSAYTLEGATLTVYDSATNQPVVDKDGKVCTFTVPNREEANRNTPYNVIFTLMYEDYQGHTLYALESQTGYGYDYVPGMRWTTTMPTRGGETGYISATNRPLYDPDEWAIAKMEDTTGDSGSNWQGDIEPSAQYTVTHYKLNEDGTKSNTIEHIWTYKTDSDGIVHFDIPSYFVSSIRGGNPPTHPNDSSRFTWPIGYYEIRETASYAGAIVNDQVFVFTNKPEQGRITDTTTLRLYAPDKVTELYHRLADGSVYRNDNYYITLPNGQTAQGTDVSDMVYHLEETLWAKLGLFKVDANLVQAGYINNNDVIREAEGDSSYVGAQYQLFVASSKDDNFFAAGAANQKNDGELSLDVAVNSVAWRDGLGNTGTTTVNSLRPVLYNGSPVIITTDGNGIAKTDIVLPYADDYRFVEIVAPPGFHHNPDVLEVQSPWTTDDQGKEIVDTNYINDKLQNTATVNGTRQGAAPDDVYTYAFTGVKEDPYNVTGQGSATTNGIRFAVINRSAGHVVMNQADVTIDPSNVLIADKAEIDPGEVVAIVTTHTVNGKEGTFRMNGLPYGKYQIVELRHDATIAPGDVYDGSTKLGSSIYANEGYLWAANDTGIIIMNDAEQNHMYDLFTYKAYLGDDAEVEDAGYKAYNRPFVDGFQAYKLDAEYLQISEGDGSLDNIRYAVVNTSAREVRLQSEYVNQADVDYIEYLDDTPLGTGKVVAILTTHTGGPSNKDGYFNIYGLPYGTYTVFELRKDATIAVGDVYNADPAKLGTSIYANDSYYFDANVYSYDLRDTYGNGAEHEFSMAASFAKHHEDWAAADNEYVDNIFRDGFFFFKRDYTFNELNSHPQGDATFNDIRYAVVNRSADPIKMFEIYNTVDSAYCEIINGQIIQPGQVAAILTSHQKGDLEGYVAIMGLPYGNYDVYELRSDATIQVGDVYNGSNKLGSSIYANHVTNSNIPGTNGHPSMLWNDTVFHYTLTDTGVHVDSEYNTDEMHGTDDQSRGTWDNETVYGTIKIVKYDRETGQTGVDGNQGTNTFEGIRYAVVNRSHWAVSYPYNDDSADAYYAPGEVIAVVAADENGEVLLDHMCYGSYDVYELKMDSTIVPHDVYDEVRNNPAKFGVDHRANRWYCWNESISNVKVTNRDLQIIEVNYVVADQEGDTIRTQDEQNVHNYYDLPIRGDFETIKVDIDGKRMPYIPFLVSLVVADENGNPITDENGNYQVIEEHIIVANSKGELNTRDFTTRPKSINNINKLDGLYDGVDFTGTYDQLMAGATQNIWFGTPDEYNTRDQYLVHRRGSLLAGTYVLQELRLTEERFGADLSTEMYDMISSRIIITNDNQVVYPFDFDIGVDIPIYIKSDALDMKSKSDAFVPDVESNLQDTIEFGNLNSSQRYGFTTAVYRVKLDGTTELLYEDDAVIPIPFDTLLALAGDKMNGATFNYNADTGEWTLAKTIANADPVFNVVHDFKVIKTTTIDTSMCEEGEYVAFTVDLYKAVGSNGWAFLMNHNNTLDEVTQKIGVIGLKTEATNKTTETRVGSLGGYAYTDGDVTKPLTNTNSLVFNKDGEIIGYTMVDDKVIYTNLADNHNYRLYAELVDDNGNTIKDIYGNDCALPYLIGLYSTEEVTEVTQGENITDIHGNILERNLTVPRDGEFTFSDLGLMDWIIPNGTNAHVVVTLYDARGPVLKRHNAAFDEESENIRWLDIQTTAMGEDGELNVLPNGKSWDIDGNVHYENVILRDRIDYTNLAEPTDIRVEGYVYLVEYNEDGTRNYDKTVQNVVAHESKVFSIADVNGSVEMQYTINSGKYEGRDLVVCERVFMDVNGEEVLIALHEDINDEMQTVSIPDIKTTAVNAHNGSKTISRVYEDVTVNDTVYYTNLKPGRTWNLTAVLYDKKTGEPVRDINGEIAQNTIEFTPETKDGSVVVPITFKQVITSLDWEDDPSWVCFETLRPGTKGSSDLEYAVHNNLHDNDQTVHRPTFRTFAESESTTEPKFINAAPGQIVMDKVEVKNIGLNVIRDEEGNVTGYEPQKFTLKIEAVDAETGEYLLNSKGEVISNTKTFTIDGTKGKMVYHEHEDVDIECDVVKFDFVGPDALKIPITIDGTKLAGKTIVFYETLYFGEECIEGEEVLIEDTQNNVNQQVTVLEKPEIGTKLLDRLTEDVTVAYGQKVELVDTVSYKNLLTGVEYKIEGILMDKDTGKPALDKNGKEITAEATFTPKETDPREGTVDVVFTVDTTELAGHTLVAYETCYELGSDKFDIEHGKTYIAEHTELEDANQTVYVLKIGTTAKDKVDGDHALDGTKTTQTIVDTIKYENLVVGKEYTVTGKLALAGTDPVQYVTDANGNVVTVTKKFTAEAPSDNPDAKTVSGTIDVEFTFDASKYAGRKVVVFEDVYYEDVRVATHSDINDTNQTLNISLLLHVAVAKRDAQNNSYLLEGAEITIYEDKECTRVAKDINGNDCIGLTGEDGNVEFTILTYDVNTTLYAKETKAPRGYLINEDVFEVHPSTNRNDDESAGKCLIEIQILDMIIVIPPKTGDNLPILPIVLFSLIGILCVGAFFALKPKKSVSDVEETDVAEANVDEEIEEEVEESVVAMMTEDIDGGICDHSGFDT